jgi:hypothetical protein
MAAGLGRVLATGALAATMALAADSRPGGQTPTPAGTGVITGRVVDATSRQPVRGANVHLTRVPENPTTVPIQDCCGVTFTPGMGADGPIATTDADGRFTFRNLLAGTMEVSATKIGWMMAWWGQQSPRDGGRWIELSDGQRVDGLEIALPRMPIVGGRVLDERGEPVGGLGILVTPVATAGPTPVFQTRRTDDRGMFRAEVMPGEYVVNTAAYPGIALNVISTSLVPAIPGRASSAWPMSAFLPVFFPQANSLDGAARLALAPGNQRTDLDFVVRPEPIFGISVSNVGEGPPGGFGVELFAASGRLPGAVPLSAASGVQGPFAFAGVPPGRYVLHAFVRPPMPSRMRGMAPAPLAALPTTPAMWAEQEIAVIDRDVDARVALQPGVRISGRVEFDGAAAPPSLSELNGQPLVIERADAADSDIRGTFLSGGRFSTIQMEPGRYVVRPVPPPDWRLKSVMSGGRDISDYPVELALSDVNDAVITFTDRRSAISAGSSAKGRTT